MGFCVWSLFCYALLSFLSSFAIILTRKRKLVASLQLSYKCLVTVGVLLCGVRRCAMGRSAVYDCGIS